jgi:hypothetical protein
VFVSYAHEDQEFVVDLVDRLQNQGLAIRYDRVALHIGDSLIRAVSHEVTQGDFMIAIVSPDFLDSEWCQHELELAMTQGIDERRVKVLPVKYRGAAMPAVLRRGVWADGDQDDPETLARKLAAAIAAHLEGRDDQAAAAVGLVAPVGGEPAHAEIEGDVGVAHVDRVADKVWDVLAQWERCREGASVADLADEQRRLRWLLDGLSDRVRASLPFVRYLSDADWQSYFRVTEPVAAEPDLREEMLAVRTRVAQGLPIVGRWLVISDYGQVPAGNRDATAYLWELQRGEETRRVTVFISGSAMGSDNDRLPQEVAAAKNTRGRSVLSSLMSLDAPPGEVWVTTAGVSLTIPD